MAICVERADLLPLFYVAMCFCHFPGSGVILDLSIPDPCLPTNFNETHFISKYQYLYINQRLVVADSS